MALNEYNKAVIEMPNNSSQKVQPAQAEPEQAHRPRVAWLVGRDTVEQLGSVVHPLAMGLIEELVELVLVCPLNGVTGQLPIPPIEVIPYRPREWWVSRARAIRSISDRLVAAKIELIHALDGGAAEFGNQLASSVGVELLVSSYCLADAERLGSLGSPSPIVLAASEAIAERMRAKHISDDRLHLVRPGMYHVSSPTCFDQVQRSAAIVACCDFDNFGPIETVLKAFATLRDKSADAVFFLIGSGQCEKQARQAVHKLGLNDELTFVDRMPAWQMPGIFKAADICVVPQAARRTDLTCLMAMAAGLPLLTPASSAPQFAIDGQTAVCYGGCDEGDLVSKLTEMLACHPVAKAIAEGAIEYIHTNHSPAQMAATTSQLYRSLT